MKVLIADPFEQSGIAGLEAAGFDVVSDAGLQGDALGAAIHDTQARVLIVRGTKVTADMFEGGNLGLIVRAGAGYNTIDVAAASERGIAVSNCPGKNAIAVAELTFGLILALDRRIPDNVVELRSGKWNKKEYARAGGLYGKTLGLIGFGNIGQEVARRAQAFGMHVVVWSRSIADGRAADQGIAIAATPGDVVNAADIVSIHVALAPETRNLVDAALIGRLKPGAFLINTSRAEVVDYGALVAAVRDRGIRVGLDVYPDEPTAGTADYHLDLLTLPGVYGTHHIGASTDQAQEAVAAETVRIVRAFAETGDVPNIVNSAQLVRR